MTETIPIINDDLDTSTETRYTYSYIDNRFEKAPKTFEDSWLNLVNFLQETGFKKTSSKEGDFPLLNLTEFDEFGRKKLNVIQMHGLVLDFDSNRTIEQICKQLEGTTFLYFTSYSHQLNDNGDRFRVVLPFLSPCPKEEYFKRLPALKELFDGVDESSLRPTQFQLFPLTHSKRASKMVMEHFEGEYFDWQDLPETISKASTLSSPDHDNTTMSSEDYIETEDGSVLASDIDGYIPKVRCPKHSDKKPTEFANVNEDGIPFIHCKHCGTIWFTDTPESLSDRRLVENIRRLKSNRKLLTDEQFQRLPKPKQYPVDKLFEFPSYTVPIPTREELNSKLDIIADNAGTMILYGPEGVGKSTLAIKLAEKEQKVIFCCKSNKQAEEKAAEFSERTQRKIQCLKGRGYQLKKHHGVDVIEKEVLYQWDYKLDTEASINAIAEQLTINYNDAGDLWHKYADSPDWSSEIIVTTHSRLRGLGAANHWTDIKKKSGYEAGSDLSPAIPTDWLIIFDDPGIEDFIDLQPRGNHYQSVNHPDKSYLVRPETLRIDVGLKGYRRIYTTTELTTTFLASEYFPNIPIEQSLMPPEGNKLVGGRIHVFATKLVRSRYDGVLPGIVNAMGDHEYLADGQGAPLNLVNMKGRNDLSEVDTVVEISQPHLDHVHLIQDQYSYINRELGDEAKCQATDAYIKAMIMIDAANQAAGRNSGARYKGKQCIILVDPQFVDSVVNGLRYSVEEVRLLDDTGMNARQPDSDDPIDQLLWKLVRYDRYCSQGKLFLDDCDNYLRHMQDIGEFDLLKKYLNRLETAIETMAEEQQWQDNRKKTFDRMMVKYR